MRISTNLQNKDSEIECFNTLQHLHFNSKDRRMETRFSNLQSCDTGNVVGFTEGSTSHRSKLLAMGLVPGVPFHVVRKAPLGDPVEIRVNGFHLCLRRKEAEMLRLKGYLQTLYTFFPSGGCSDINSTRP